MMSTFLGAVELFFRQR